MKKIHLKQWIAAAIIFFLAATGLACGKNQADKISSSPEAQAPAKTLSASAFPGEASYEDIYKNLKEIESSDTIVTEGGASFFGIQKESAAADTSAGARTETYAGTGGYSKTNLQELGVDEADVLKTDSSYLYVLKTNGKLQIVTADGADSKIVGSIDVSSPEEVPEEMYLDGNTLNLITSGCNTQMQARGTDVYEADTNYFTTLYTYDISDRTDPKLTGSIKQEGYYSTSRKNGSVVYLFTQYNPDLASDEVPEKYIPSVNGEILKETDICVPEYKNTTGYLVISSVDTKKPSETLDRKAIISAVENYYVSPENIYIYNTNYTDTAVMTQLMRFSCKDGKIVSADAADLKGYINDSFSLNEYNGYLRVVVTEDKNNSQINSLYVLDGKFEVCGSITDLAEGETIQSARFMGDIGYFVTFKNMDPLFSVDLKDPKNPKILGELKVSGFSSYLHFYGENQLLGVGEEVDPKTGEYYGLKLSMFDISDPSNVTETHKYVLKDTYSCSLLDNYKSVMIDPEKNVIGFMVDNEYMIFSYDKKEGFRNVFTETLIARTNGYYDVAFVSFRDGYARGCYSGDTFYLIWNGKINMFDMKNDYKSIGDIEL